MIKDLALAFRRLTHVSCIGLAAMALLTGCVAEPAETSEEDVAETSYTSFDDFEAATAREAETGYYIVDGDIPIYTREELFDFYQNYVAQGQLIVHTASGVDVRWNDVDKLALTYCVSKAFGANYAAVAKAMNDAGAAWSHAANVRFIHMTDQDGACSITNNRVMFDVQPVSGQVYMARAFFPNGTRDKRNVLIDSKSFGAIAPLTLTGVLRHELGHALGFRHEHTRPEAGLCFEDNNWRDATSYDSYSVMHYNQCNGMRVGDLVLTEQDRLGAAAIYGRRHGGAYNLAFLKGTSQSSTYATAAAALAVDGNVDGDFFHNSVTHTNGEASPWWQVDLGNVQPVGEVILHNRIDNSNAPRLGNFKLLVSRDGATWRTIDYPGKVGARAAIAVNETSRFIKVQLNADGTTRYLHLAEVEVLAPRNLAKGRYATQSTTYVGAAAARAVDGNTSGVFSGNSVTHTNAEPSPWWQVDLGAIQPIGEVVLYNRTDCCSERLSYFKLMVSNDGVTWSTYPYNAKNTAARLAMPVNRTGRYVKVQLDNLMNVPRYLSIAEVEVLAARNLALGKMAAQSSDLVSGQGAASNAIDGSTNGNFGDGSTTTTAQNMDSMPWWILDLGYVMPVGEVILYNRTDCCSDQLTNFKLQTSADGSGWTDVRQVNSPVGVFQQIVANRPARYVRVQLDNIGIPRVLSLAEVEVIAARNLSLGSFAVQSSTYLGGENIPGYASRANDGNTDGNFFNQSVSHTNSDAQAFWSVDFGSAMPINEVVIYNRTDGGSDRLSDFKVQTSEDGMTYKDFPFPGTASARETFKTLRSGRYVRVQLNGTNILHMAEVESYLWN